MADNVKKSSVSLASLLTPSKTLTMDYPDIEGWTVELTYLAREELMKVRKEGVTEEELKNAKNFLINSYVWLTRPGLWLTRPGWYHPDLVNQTWIFKICSVLWLTGAKTALKQKAEGLP